MAGLLRYSAAAEEDLLSIHAYVRERNPTAASRLVRSIDAKCQLLAERPGLGTIRDDIRTGMRVWVVGRYLVLYRIADDGIEVVRIVHGRRSLKRVFGGAV